MFTGIVEEMGRVLRLAQVGTAWQLEVDGPLVCQGTRLGESIAVNGVCLTVEQMQGSNLRFGLAPETLARTNLGALQPGTGVNLERALAANGRLGGHFLQGHVDATGTLVARQPDGDSLRMAVAAPPQLLRYVVAKGFIAIDGVSLTVIDALEDRFTFMLVAYTQQHVTLAHLPLGAPVNLEADILAKYIEKLYPR